MKDLLEQLLSDVQDPGKEEAINGLVKTIEFIEATQDKSIDDVHNVWLYGNLKPILQILNKHYVKLCDNSRCYIEITAKIDALKEIASLCDAYLYTKNCQELVTEIVRLHLKSASYYFTFIKHGDEDSEQKCHIWLINALEYIENYEL